MNKQIFLVIHKERIERVEKEDMIFDGNNFACSNPPHFVLVVAESKEQAIENALANSTHDRMDWLGFNNVEKGKVKKEDLITYSAEDLPVECLIPTGCC